MATPSLARTRREVLHRTYTRVRRLCLPRRPARTEGRAHRDVVVPGVDVARQRPIDRDARDTVGGSPSTIFQTALSPCSERSVGKASAENTNGCPMPSAYSRHRGPGRRAAPGREHRVDDRGVDAGHVAEQQHDRVARRRPRRARPAATTRSPCRTRRCSRPRPARVAATGRPRRRCPRARPRPDRAAMPRRRHDVREQRAVAERQGLLRPAEAGRPTGTEHDPDHGTHAPTLMGLDHFAHWQGRMCIGVLDCGRARSACGGECDAVVVRTAQRPRAQRDCEPT